jgi:hypothetical protein
VLERIYPSSDDAEPGGEDDDESEPTDDEVAIARNAHSLLSEWRHLPGMDADGAVDGNALRQWVDDVLGLATDPNRRWGALHHIAGLLATSPAEPDGRWPSPAVSDLVEHLDDREFEDELYVAILNARGGTMRGAYDGGDQERLLAESFRNRTRDLVDRWPRTAAVLRRVSEDYERTAREYETEAERRRTGFDS